MVISWMDFERELEDPYYLSIRVAIEQKAEEYGMTVQGCSLDALDETLRDAQGVLILGRLSADRLQEIKSKNEAMVIMDNNFTVPGYDYVGVNLMDATREVLEYLYELGHRKIGYLGGVTLEQQKGRDFVDHRDIAYADFMREKNIYDEDYIYDVEQFTFKAAYRRVLRVLRGNKLPSVIFAANDSMAIAAYRAIDECGLKIPDDISVVGFNDQPNAKYLVPSLATVHIPIAHLGYAALDLLIDKLRTQRDYAKRLYLETRFVVRNSCKEVKI